jgi:hypothetical protein
MKALRRAIVASIAALVAVVSIATSTTSALNADPTVTADPIGQGSEWEWT